MPTQCHMHRAVVIIRTHPPWGKTNIFIATHRRQIWSMLTRRDGSRQHWHGKSLSPGVPKHGNRYRARRRTNWPDKQKQQSVKREGGKGESCRQTDCCTARWQVNIWCMPKVCNALHVDLNAATEQKTNNPCSATHTHWPWCSCHSVGPLHLTVLQFWTAVLTLAIVANSSIRQLLLWKIKQTKSIGVSVAMHKQTVGHIWGKQTLITIINEIICAHCARSIWRTARLAIGLSHCAARYGRRSVVCSTLLCQCDNCSETAAANLSLAN